MIQTFWHFLYYLVNLQATCVVVTQSTHGTIETQQPIVYGGQCIEAFKIALQSHGAWAWEIWRG